jgi:predicted DNA-binding protein (MmcQ/YjbR family)
MNAEEIRTYCLAKIAVEESFPFDNDTLVFKVGGKIFLLLSISSKPLQFNVKCDPDMAIDLREKYSFVLPGYHMNKQHWNTVLCINPVPKKLILEWIDHSYDLVVSSLPKKAREALKR